MKKNLLNCFLIALFSGFALMGCQQSSTLELPKELEDFSLTNYAYFNAGNIPIDLHKIIGLNDTLLDVNKETLNSRVTLGRVLFYDNNLSANGSLSCSTCHDQSKAFCDGKAFSEGLFDGVTDRSSMSLTNLGFQKRFFWDVRTGNLDEAVMMPIQNHVEMGILKVEDLPGKLNQLGYYGDLVNQAFQQTALSEDIISTSLGLFVASMISYDSKFDKVQGNNLPGFTSPELAGKELFFGKALCENCHQGNQFTSNWRIRANIGLPALNGDGVEPATKVPGLRNVELTAPYMHDGRFETLMEVVDHYNSGIQFNQNLDWALRSVNDPVRLNLTETEKEQLVAFLKTLTDYSFINDPKFSNPFK